MMNTRTRTALAVALACLPFLAQAQESMPPAPEMTAATYRAWTLRCATDQGDGPQRMCEVAQTLAAAPGGNLIGQIAIGRLAADQPLKLVVQLPSGVWLPANVQLDAAGGTGITAIYTTCRQMCAAEAEPDDAFVQALRQSPEPATLTLQDGAQQTVSVSIPLDGFDAAMTAMNTEMASE